MRRHGPVRLSVSAVIPALLLTACSAKGDPAPAATHHRGGAQADRKLTAQAQSALDAASDGGSSMVESGVERVSDGVHTQPGLTHGAAYKLTVVCIGKGAAELVVTSAGAGGKKAVPCDGSVVFERLTAESALKVDVQGKPGAAGMIAWRINKT
ncbi:hypothetical protein [Streptomyces griseofuscus]|uniref:hypothetical protein n=1 Tax=Streptomyces griseofuscus TaxID=146922 RepID=UPI0037FA9890